MPQVSIPDESVKFNYDSQRQYILFQGTEVMQGKTRQGNYCKAVVIRTGERREEREEINNVMTLNTWQAS